MTWPATPTLERSSARWVAPSHVRAGRGGFRPDLPHAVVVVEVERCPECEGATHDDEAHLDALFRHGGFGASLRTIRRACTLCAWALVLEVSEERPPR